MSALILAVIILLYILIINRSWFLRTPSYTALSRHMRKLWSDHVHWTREYVVLTVENIASRQYTANRLMKNQKDIGDLFGKYYGPAEGDKLTKLLQEHISIAVRIVDVMRSGQNPEKDVQLWYANADTIGDYLQQHNPRYWTKAKDMMRAHLDSTVAEVTKYVNSKRGVSDVKDINDRGADIIQFEKVLDQAMMMADILTDGIVIQSPFLFLF